MAFTSKTKRTIAKNSTLDASAWLAPMPRFADAQRREKLAAAFPSIREMFREFHESQNVPGLAFGIVVDGELAFAETMGVQNVETRVPVTLDSVFRIASMSKSFIAMSILKLRDAKKLRLDDPVAKYIPEFKTLAYPTRDSAVITVRDLLTMSPGFPEDNPWGDRQMAITAREFTQWLRAGIPFSNAPNSTFEYSNYGYAILGRIVSRVSGISFQDYVTQNILRPLKMRATTWDKTRVPQKHFAQGYRYQDETYLPEPILPDGAFAGMAGLFTTIPDFARYMAFLLDAFPPRDERERGPVSRATAREMQQMMRFEDIVTRNLDEEKIWRAANGYGYGLAILHDERFGYGVAHGGGLPGYGTFYYLLPEYGIGIVAFSNRTYARVGTVFTKIFDAFERTGGLQPRVPQPAPILTAMRDAVQHWLETGDDTQIAARAADNFYLDADAAHRQKDLEKIRAELGAFRVVGEFRALNALRGLWHIECERGSLEIFITLAPTLPPQLQMCRLTAALAEQT